MQGAKGARGARESEGGNGGARVYYVVGSPPHLGVQGARGSKGGEGILCCRVPTTSGDARG